LFSRSTITNEWRILPTDGSSDNFKVFQPRITGLEYLVSHHADQFFIITNENAQNFKLMVTPIEETTKENWSEVIPHRPDVFIEDLDTFEDFIVLYERRDGFTQIRISDPDGVSNVRYIPFPEPVYAVSTMPNPEFKTDQLRIKYTSLVTPNSVIDYHIQTGKWDVKKVDEIPSGYDASQYESGAPTQPRLTAHKYPCPLCTKRACRKIVRIQHCYTATAPMVLAWKLPSTRIVLACWTAALST
jgi:oligopeptidase B